MENRQHILVAEDEAHTRLSLSVLLKRAGYRVTSVSDGTKALELMMKSAEGGADFIDLLMTDMQMPELGGLELLRSLKAKGIRTPVLAFTGFGDKEMVVELLREGCEDYIDKPFGEDDLLKRIEKLFSKERSKVKELEIYESRIEETRRKLDNYRKAFAESCDSIESAVSAYKKIAGERATSRKAVCVSRSLPKDRLGGDFIAICDRPWGFDFIFADVAGHDMGASYHTIMIKSFFDVNCQLGGDGEEFLRTLNKELRKDGRNERMVVALFGRVDLNEMWLETSAAGHSNLLLQRNDGRLEDFRSEDAFPPGQPLGILENVALAIHRTKLAPGDRIIVYSDGLPEARVFDPGKLETSKIGDETIRRLLLSGRAKPLEDAISSAWDAIMLRCGAKAHSDMSLLAMEIPAASLEPSASQVH